MKNTIITISRQHGSGGREIGRKLAGQLGIPFYDNEIITAAAKASGYAEEIFHNAEQQGAGSLLFSLSMFSSSGGSAGMPLSDRVFLIQSDVIKKMAAEGDGIFVGRCADYVLGDSKELNCINLYVYSDFDKRVARAIDEYHLDKSKAADTVRKMDKKRAAYYEYYTGNKWGRAENYHLSINSGIIGTENSVSLIKSFVELIKDK